MDSAGWLSPMMNAIHHWCPTVSIPAACAIKSATGQACHEALYGDSCVPGMYQDIEGTAMTTGQMCNACGTGDNGATADCSNAQYKDCDGAIKGLLDDVCDVAFVKVSTIDCGSESADEFCKPNAGTGAAPCIADDNCDSKSAYNKGYDVPADTFIRLKGYSTVIPSHVIMANKMTIGQATTIMTKLPAHWNTVQGTTLTSKVGKTTEEILGKSFVESLKQVPFYYEKYKVIRPITVVGGVAAVAAADVGIIALTQKKMYQEKMTTQCSEQGAGWTFIASKTECEQAAVSLSLVDVDINSGNIVSAMNFPPGCYLGYGTLRFNNKFDTDFLCTSNWKCVCTLICPAGTYQNEIGKLTCKLCTTASVLDTSSSESVQYEFQRYSTAGASSCDYTATTCPTGTFATGNAGCVACSTGTYSTAGASSCEYTAATCPKGTYSSGTAACAPCPSGTFQNEEGKTMCKTCTGDNHSTAGASNCDYTAITCPKGTFSSGTAACAACKEGKYNEQDRQTSESDACKYCDVGKYNDDEIGKITKCTKTCPCIVEGEDEANCVRKESTMDFKACMIPGTIFLETTSGTCANQGDIWGSISSTAVCKEAALFLGWFDKSVDETGWSSETQPPGCVVEQLYGLIYGKMYLNTDTTSTDLCSSLTKCACTFSCPKGTYQNQIGQTT